MKTFWLLVLVGLATLLTGCPSKVDPGANENTKLGESSKRWGTPLTRVVTGGFNGIVSEPNNTGPAGSKPDSAK